jgi:small basic protein (TIGR04137 family)
MSQHTSFRQGSGSSKKKRNVLKRFERIDLMKKRGVWKEGTKRVTGLPKTRIGE